MTCHSPWSIASHALPVLLLASTHRTRSDRQHPIVLGFDSDRKSGVDAGTSLLEHPRCRWFLTIVGGRAEVGRELPIRGADLGMIVGMVSLPVEEFEQLVADALDEIPKELGAMMDNVAVVVDDRSPPGRLLGLYEGVPLTRRGNSYSAAVPDRITIFMATICASCRTEEDVVALVRRTVVHEVAHHFGIDDQRLEDLGWA